MIGPNVNLAARLMCLPMNPGILVEQTTMLASEYSVEYQHLGEVKVKGKEEVRCLASLVVYIERFT